MAPKYKPNGVDSEDEWDRFTVYLEKYLEDPLKEFCRKNYMKRNQAINLLIMKGLGADLAKDPSFWNPS